MTNPEIQTKPLRIRAMRICAITMCVVAAISLPIHALAHMGDPGYIRAGIFLAVICALLARFLYMRSEGRESSFIDVRLTASTDELQAAHIEWISIAGSIVFMLV